MPAGMMTSFTGLGLALAELARSAVVTGSKFTLSYERKIFTVFTSLYYYAFLDKGSDSEFGMLRVAMSLGSLMTVGQLSQMLLRIWVPQVIHHWRSYWRHVRIKREESEVAMQANRRSMRARAVTSPTA